MRHDPKTAGGKRWRQWTEQEARATMAELSRSGATSAAFARSKGVSTERLAYWRKRLSVASAPAFVSVTLPPRSASSSRAEIEVLVGGVVIRFRDDVDAERVASIVRALTREAS
jgi:hypothetical protein